MKLKNYVLIIMLFASSVVFPQTGVSTNYTLPSGRVYRLYVPAIYDGSVPVPLLLNNHGMTLSKENQEEYGDFRPIADTANFITVATQGNGNDWDISAATTSGQADRNYLYEVIDSIKSQFNINACRIYTAGFSKGGFMSHNLNINIDQPGKPRIFAAFGAVAGGISNNNGANGYWQSKKPQTPTPCIHIHGAGDDLILYAGGNALGQVHTDTLIKYWVDFNNCNPTPTVYNFPDGPYADNNTTATKYTYTGGDRGSQVVLIKTTADHQWPTDVATPPQARGTGDRNRDFNASLEIWNFVSQFCLPYLTSTTCTESPTISAQTGNTTICSGNSTTLSVTASGCVGTALTYQWQVNTGSGFSNLTNAAPYSGVTTSTLTITSATTALNTYQYRCFVSSCCDVSYSANAILTVTNCCSSPSITSTTPASRCGAGFVTLTATSSSGNINWYAASTGGSPLNTNSTDYTTPVISFTTTYYVDATDNGCTSSRTAVVATVVTPPDATISGNQTICSGTSATISTTLSGNSSWTIIYSIDGVNQTPVTATSSPYTFTTSVAGVYEVDTLSDGDGSCGSRPVGSATITENTAITVSTSTVTCDANNTNYTVEFDISGGDMASYTVDGSSINIASSHFTSSTVASGTTYTFTVNDVNNCSAVIVSGTKTCSVTCNATASISGDATICSGTSATISIALAGNPPWSITYAIDGVNQTPDTTSSSTYTFTTSTTGVYTLASVSDNNSCTATPSGSATITERTPITVSTSTITCDANNTNYTIEFDISGGDMASYTVDGSSANITSSHFTSSNLASGTTNTFTVNDVNNCSAVIVSETKTCSVTCNATADISGDATICSGTSATISIALAGNPPWSITYAIDGVNQTPDTTSSSMYTFTTSSAGVYTLVSVTDVNSCTATKSGSATIIVNALPTVSTVANPSSAAVCIGSTVTLSGAGAVNYFWSGGISDGVAFVPSVGSTTYTVSGTDGNNCSNTTTKTVTAYPLPTVGITASPASASVCAGSTVILIGTGAASYSWSTGSTTNAITLVPAITETITVTGTDANSCTNTATKIVIVENCNPGTGIEENTSVPSFSVYPNPTGGMIRITISNASDTEVMISVINVFGTEVFSTVEKNIPADHTKQINLGGLAKGMYYIKLKIGSDTQVTKLLVQ